jgi:hypothetical protein
MIRDPRPIDWFGGWWLNTSYDLDYYRLGTCGWDPKTRHPKPRRTYGRVTTLRGAEEAVMQQLAAIRALNSPHRGLMTLVLVRYVELGTWRKSITPPDVFDAFEAWR